MKYAVIMRDARRNVRRTDCAVIAALRSNRADEIAWAELEAIVAAEDLAEITCLAESQR